MPHLASLEDVVVGGSEHFWFDNSVSHLRNLVTSGPDIPEEDWLALLVVSKWLSLEIEIDGTSESVGNNEGW